MHSFCSSSELNRLALNHTELNVQSWCLQDKPQDSPSNALPLPKGIMEWAFKYSPLLSPCNPKQSTITGSQATHDNSLTWTEKQPSARLLICLTSHPNEACSCLSQKQQLQCLPGPCGGRCLPASSLEHLTDTSESLRKRPWIELQCNVDFFPYLERLLAQALIARQ